MFTVEFYSASTMSTIAPCVKSIPTQSGPPKKKYLTVVPSLFSVVSWGCAGTAWLARALNSHPDVFCVQGANHYLQSMRGIAPMDGLEYMHVIAAIATGHSAVGDVHGISRHLIPELRENYGDVFSSAVVVRDPLPRMHSQLALFKTLPAAGLWDLGYVEALAVQLGQNPAAMTQEDRLKLHAFNMLNTIVEEKLVGPIYRIEDLVGKRDSMASLLDHLTHGRLQSPGWWLDHVQNLPALNGHKEPGQRPEFLPEELRILSQVVTPEAKALYRDLGYTVDW